MDTFLPFNLVIDIEKNNTWIIDKIKETDENTHNVLKKVSANVFMLHSLGETELAISLAEKYKTVIISAYEYFLKKKKKNNRD